MPLTCTFTEGLKPGTEPSRPLDQERASTWLRERGPRRASGSRRGFACQLQALAPLGAAKPARQLLDRTTARSGVLRSSRRGVLPLPLSWSPGTTPCTARTQACGVGNTGQVLGARAGKVDRHHRGRRAAAPGPRHHRPGPARLGMSPVDEPRWMSPVDEAGDNEVSLPGRSHRGVVLDDVHGVAYSPVTRAGRRSSSRSRSCCSPGVGRSPFTSATPCSPAGLPEQRAGRSRRLRDRAVPEGPFTQTRGASADGGTPEEDTTRRRSVRGKDVSPS
ncbi:hypothetical protein ACVWXU_000536 [Streptomyces sp. TE33382]